MNYQQSNKINAGIKEGVFKVENNRIYYAHGKDYNFNDPEEIVRAELIYDLVKVYKYHVNAIDTEVYPYRRDPQLPADIVIYTDDAERNSFLVIEVKANDSLKDIAQAQRQALGNSHMLDSIYFMIQCKGVRYVYKNRKGLSLKKLEGVLIVDIPVSYVEKDSFRFVAGQEGRDLISLDDNELRNVLKKCHHIIWSGGKKV